jgi:hypothetical protein
MSKGAILDRLEKVPGRAKIDLTFLPVSRSKQVATSCIADCRSAAAATDISCAAAHT